MNPRLDRIGERLLEGLVYLFIVAAVVAFGCLTWLTFVGGSK